MDDEKVRIRVPAGSKGVIKPGKDNSSGKMVLPPGKLRVAEKDENGNIVLEIMEQDGTDKVLSDMEKRIQKASTTMTGDNKREASRAIDSIRKKKIESMQRGGVSTKKSSNALQIAENNSQTMADIRQLGGMGFDHFSMSNAEKREIESLNEKYRANYLLDLDEAYEEFSDIVRSILDNYRNPSGEVVEEETKVSEIFKKVAERKENEEIIEILEKLALQIHAGFERFLYVEANADIFNLLSERKMFQRPQSNGSHAQIQRDGDLTLGVPVGAPNQLRPISALLSHSGHAVPDAVKKNKNFKPEFYSESTKPKIVLKPEVFGRSGYTRNAGIFDTAYSVSSVSRDKEQITLAVLGGISRNNSEKKNTEMLDIYLEAAVTGNYSEIIGNKENPGFRAYIMGGFMKDEVELIEYPTAALDLDSVEIKPRDVVLGEDVLREKLKAAQLSEDQINSFMGADGAIKELKKLDKVAVYLQTKAADKVKVELSQLNISDIRFVNPQGVDIFDPYSFQSLSTRLLESGSRIVSIAAIKQVDAFIKTQAEKIKKGK